VNSPRLAQLSTVQKYGNFANDFHDKAHANMISVSATKRTQEDFIERDWLRRQNK
jgi:hypothetical protein